MVCRTGSSEDQNQHAIPYRCSRIEVDGRQVTIYHTAGVHEQLRYQFISTHNGKPAWSTEVFVCTFREIEHHDVVSSGILDDGFCDKHPQEGTKQASTTVEDATEAYIVEVIAESDM